MRTMIDKCDDSSDHSICDTDDDGDDDSDHRLYTVAVIEADEAHPKHSTNCSFSLCSPKGFITNDNVEAYSILITTMRKGGGGKREKKNERQ